MSNNYQSNPTPLLAPYNNTSLYSTPPPFISIDKLGQLRGHGLWDPAPLYIQTTDNGNAYSDIHLSKKYKDYINQNEIPYYGDLNVTLTGAVEAKDSWDYNLNYNLKTIDNDNYKLYDEYQMWALNALRIDDPYLLPYLFSKINVKFIQDSVVEHVKKARNITINTYQDTDNLLNLMLANYKLYKESNGVYIQDNDNDNDNSCKFSSILGNLNKNIIEKYIQSVFTGLNIYDYYINDITTLPIPLTRPVSTYNKGSKVLGYVGPFEDNYEFTRNINSFNSRNTIPGIIDSVNFGN